MAAIIPSRTDEANARALASIQAAKRREATDGFDGTWVAHPDAVDAAAAEFDAVFGEAPNQIARKRDAGTIDAAALLDIAATPGAVTEAGVHGNVNVAFQDMSSWLSGRGAVALHGFMEDSATAETTRTQHWHWIHHGDTLDDGRIVTAELVLELLGEETAAIAPRSAKRLGPQADQTTRSHSSRPSSSATSSSSS